MRAGDVEIVSARLPRPAPVGGVSTVDISIRFRVQDTRSASITRARALSLHLPYRSCFEELLCLMREVRNLLGVCGFWFET